MSEPGIIPPSPFSKRGPRRVEASVLRGGSAAGLVAAAAVIGLLIGIGRRAGTAFRPLNATAAAVLGTRADGVWGFDAIVTVVGVLVVLALSTLAGTIVARLSPSFRTLRTLVAAAGVAIVGYLLHVHVAARMDVGLSALLSVGELRALYVTLASALVLGIRLAFSTGTSVARG
ncbi:MAG TPA: hypothetical protein VKA54_07025 [Gemmatimonadaceae bacterium]|nr:hypothetical protein [Gemmatimonadaceae bacterium]